MITNDVIAHNLLAVRDVLNETARRSGRDSKEIKLIAVSKTHSTECITAALNCNQIEFGESTIQEALPKITQFKNRNVTWHFIGHLQSNKTRFIPNNFSWVHSIDSFKIAHRLSCIAKEKSSVINALIEINITRDPQKHGILPEKLFPLLDNLLKQDLSGLSLRGLMTIGPYLATKSETHAAFSAIRELRDHAIRHFHIPLFTELSMGMSNDYKEAIEEGSTMIRIGTSIFGDREY